MIGGPRRRSAEDILQKLAAEPGRSPRPQSRPGPSAPQRPQAPAGDELVGHHDNAIRNHLAGLVRALLQTGDMAKLHELLVEHRSFIDGIITLIEGKNPH